MVENDVNPEDDWDRNHLSEEECKEILSRLFPNGLAGEDILGELAPEGWENSPFVRVFHPTPLQLFDHSIELHRDLEEIRLPGDPPEPPPTLEEAEKNSLAYPKLVRPSKECEELVGRCLWDIFSDNHDVTRPDGKLVDLGSFRGTGGFIADWLNAKGGNERYDYLDFYMGTCGLGGRADLTPLYGLIFRRLRSLGLDWVYHFPKLGIVMMGSAEENELPLEEYDPSESLIKKKQERNRKEEAAQFLADLEKDHQEAVREAREERSPTTVQAYLDVYGRLPRGWPPQA